MKKAPFITFEGVDGSGKTTLMKHLFDEVKKQNIEAICTREPGGTKLGELLRSVVLDSDLPVSSKAELGLFLSSRMQHIVEIIVPAQSKGQIVFCDRFHDSSIAYQGAARELGEDFVEQACSTFTGNFQPDLTFYLDISPENAMKRSNDTRDRIESQSLSFHKKIHSSYQRLAKKYPERIRIIDANLSIEEVLSQAKIILFDYLGKGFHA